MSAPARRAGRVVFDQLLADFFDNEVDEYVRAQLLDAVANLTTGRRYFAYNCFNVRVDADSGTVTVEDELDVDREVTISFSAFRERLLPPPSLP